MKLNRIGGINESNISVVIAQHARAADALTLVFTRDTATAARLKKELDFFYTRHPGDAPSQERHPDDAKHPSGPIRKKASTSVYASLNRPTTEHAERVFNAEAPAGFGCIELFPDWETLPYDQFSPHQDITSERLRLLHRLPSLKNGIIIASIETAMHRLPPKHFLAGHVFCLEIGDTLNLNTYPESLAQAGYTRVQQVLTKGEFALRGSILDLFPMGSKHPFRIELFDDEVATIRHFDPESQRSTDQIDSVHFLPACEYPLTNEAINRFNENWDKHFPESTQDSPLYQAIQEKRAAGGIEYYLPFFFDNTATIFDYLPQSTQIFHAMQTHEQAESFWAEIEERHAIYQYDLDRPALAPLESFYHPTQVFSKTKTFTEIKLVEKTIKNGPSQLNIAAHPIPDIAFNASKKTSFELLDKWLNTHQSKVLFSAESPGRREMLIEHLGRQGLQADYCETWAEFQSNQSRLQITISPIQNSIWLKDQNWILLTERSLFTNFVPQARRTATKDKAEESGILVRDLSELKIGDAIVHITHGIGRYHGLEKITAAGIESECIQIEYKGGDKLFVPISDLHDITLYSGSDMQFAPISRLGSDRWEKDKAKAAKRIRDVAAELLAIYAKREAKTGFTYKRPDEDFSRFCASFPFEETQDQLKAISSVIDDMHKPKPMDRLLCGDVGFGKTEVAMRAAFIAVHQLKQVAILVPTTLLAQQHFESFSDRFADWPVNIELLSRFRSATQQKEIIQKTRTGQVDILIGTHKILSKDIHFKDLGLLVVDEEHRFGVRHKERIKAMRTDVDILTMTATPIPRTLNMAFSSLRDLSLIATPPAKRLSVKTFVKEYNKDSIKEAITREIHRGGQVYFLFNDVARIEAQKEELQTILPDINIGIGHGQMRERELEKIMADFYHNRYHVLLCTTIIETGIDVPNANTIIIDRSDKFGLAQLHQLRGRVGRSHHQAYAYLLTPPKSALSNDAKLRLDAIKEASHLGAGFTIASHDLDIRGAGELLGDEQSGNMDRIGFNLYMDLLDKTVKALKSGKSLDLESMMENVQIEVDLNICALIPEDYVPDISMRLSLYKRISDADSDKALNDLKVEMIDRFGLLPDQVNYLSDQASLKIQAIAIGIKRISASAKNINFEFGPNHKVQPEKIILLIQKNYKTHKLKGPTTLSIVIDSETTDADKLKTCFEFIKALTS